MSQPTEHQPKQDTSVAGDAAAAQPVEFQAVREKIEKERKESESGFRNWLLRFGVFLGIVVGTGIVSVKVFWHVADRTLEQASPKPPATDAAPKKKPDSDEPPRKPPEPREDDGQQAVREQERAAALVEQRRVLAVAEAAREEAQAALAAHDAYQERLSHVLDGEEGRRILHRAGDVRIVVEKERPGKGKLLALLASAEDLVRLFDRAVKDRHNRAVPSQALEEKVCSVRDSARDARLSYESARRLLDKLVADAVK